MFLGSEIRLMHNAIGNQRHVRELMWKAQTLFLFGFLKHKVDLPSNVLHTGLVFPKTASDFLVQLGLSCRKKVEGGGGGCGIN